MAEEQLPRTAAQQAAEANARSKWPREVKPRLSHAMHDLSILCAAARLLEEPVYLFGDDANADYPQPASNGT
eukprot:1433638-Pleurochrysis_carterae.AAC.1